MSKISKNIKKFRKLSEMTQEDLAAKIHVTRQTVSSWETDRTQPDLGILQTLAEVFGIEVEELIYGKRRNTAEEKEKQLFGNTLITVLSVLGCLLIGAGVVMIFIKLWRNMPEAFKIFACFIPAVLGQGVGIYTYIKKKESVPWCEGASVLWLLGVTVTVTVLLGNSGLNYYIVSDSWMFVFFALSALVLMLVFRTLSPLAVVYVCSLVAFVICLDEGRLYTVDEDTPTGTLIKYLILVLAQAAITAACFFASAKIYKKEKDIIRYTFASWINFAGLAFFVWFALERTKLRYEVFALVVTAAIICYFIGQLQTDFVSPYRVLGLPASAAALCYIGMFSNGANLATPQWVNIVILILGLIPLGFILFEKSRPKSVYLRVYGILLVAALTVCNAYVCIDKAYYVENPAFSFEALERLQDIVLTVSFLIAVAGFVMLIIYGAKERKLLYLNLGFILSCVTVIARLYILDLGLIATGILLIVCGAGLLAVNLKISRLRERELAQALSQGEEAEQ